MRTCASPSRDRGRVGLGRCWWPGAGPNTNSCLLNRGQPLKQECDRMARGYCLIESANDGGADPLRRTRLVRRSILAGQLVCQPACGGGGGDGGLTSGKPLRWADEPKAGHHERRTKGLLTMAPISCPLGRVACRGLISLSGPNRCASKSEVEEVLVG